MKHLLAPAAVCLLAFTTIYNASAEEKNGLSVIVLKRTLERGGRTFDAKGSRQGFQVTFKNVAMKPFPEGEVNWEIYAKRKDRVEKYSGTETLKPLRSSESAEMTIGDVFVPEQQHKLHDRYNEEKFELDYRITVEHAGKETIHLNSTADFDSLERRAVSMDHRKDKQNGNDAPQPRGAEPKNEPKDEPAPVAATPMPTPRPAAVVEPPPIQSFDFFNVKKAK